MALRIIDKRVKNTNSEVQRDGTANNWQESEKHGINCLYSGAIFRVRQVVAELKRIQGASERGAYRPNLEVAPRMKVDLVPCCSATLLSVTTLLHHP
jgi:hypothetical protein